MLTPRQSGPSRTAAGARNLFLDADPDEHALAPERSEQQRARTSRPSRQRRRGRGLLTPVGSSSSPTAAGRDAATFTRTRLGAGPLATAVLARLRRADAHAAALLRGLADRNYGGLAAAALLAVMLISLSWLGLALRETSAARGVTERERIAAIASLTRDQHRIGGLTAQLNQESVIALAREQASAATVESFKLRAQLAESRLAHARGMGQGRPAARRDRGKTGR
ncbi:MAG: hypothetical protein WB557_22405 [Solirubrobacteraceae bacterium]